MESQSEVAKTIREIAKTKDDRKLMEKLEKFLWGYIEEDESRKYLNDIYEAVEPIKFGEITFKIVRHSGNTTRLTFTVDVHKKYFS